MAPKYELIYFDFPGLAEPIRIMFNVAGVEFTDTRYTRDEWPKQKPDQRRFPLGQLPVLLVDDKVIHQSNTISRFVARELGFYGDTNFEGAENDVVLDTLLDIQKKLTPLFSAPNEEAKKEMVEEFVNTTAKPYFVFLESHFKQRAESRKKMSLADFHMFNTCDLLMHGPFMIPGAFDNYPSLVAFYNTFKQIEKVKQHLDSRK